MRCETSQSPSQTTPLAKEYEFHEAANLFPLLEGTEFDDLVESIRSNGQRDAIETLDGKILDGRNRYRACIAAGVEPEFCEEEPQVDDPVQYVLDKNVHRRHLTTSQRAMVAADAKKLYAEQAKQRQKRKPAESVPEKLPEQKGDARDKAGIALRVSGRSVDYAEKVIQSGDEKLINDVKAGKVSVSKAAKIIKNGTATSPGENIAARTALCGEIEHLLGQLRAKLAKQARSLGHKNYRQYVDCVDSVNGLAVSWCKWQAIFDDTLDEENRAALVATAEARRDKGSIAAKSYDGYSQGHILRDILSRTCDDWRALELNVPINAKSFPQKNERRKEIARLKREVRTNVNLVLDRIDKEFDQSGAMDMETLS